VESINSIDHLTELTQADDLTGNARNKGRKEATRYTMPQRFGLGATTKPAVQTRQPNPPSRLAAWLAGAIHLDHAVGKWAGGICPLPCNRYADFNCLRHRAQGHSLLRALLAMGLQTTVCPQCRILHTAPQNIPTNTVRRDHVYPETSWQKPAKRAFIIAMRYAIVML